MISLSFSSIQAFMEGSGKDLSVDLLVIGGGITGVGIAQDAAARGLKTALVEKGDFADGTSSRSSKLIHGGLRYLQQFSLGLMYESITERDVLTRLAPGLVAWTPCLYPFYEDRGGRRKAKLGFVLYDFLSRANPNRRHRSMDLSEISKVSPELRRDGLTGGAMFYDCCTDDARLVLAVALDAEERGARMYNYVQADELLRVNGRARGAGVRDVLTGAERRIHARKVVCAAGPWTDGALGMLGEPLGVQRVRPAKGIHIVLPRGRLAINQIHLIPSARDRRFLFVIPWYEGIIVGTTDTDYTESPDRVRAGIEDVSYVLDAIAWSFPDARVETKDLVATYAGVRPLVNAPGRSTSDVPREYRMFESPSSVLCVVGGKLTTYRRMAKAVVDRVIRSLRSDGSGSAFLPSRTRTILLGHPPEEGFDPLAQCSLPEDVRLHLTRDYGFRAQQIVSLIEEEPEFARRMVSGLPYIFAEAQYAAVYEKARTLEDVLVRRTRVALLDRGHGMACAAEVARIMARALGWAAADERLQIEHYARTIHARYSVPE